MAQLLFMGASIEYGVGGAHGGWADLVKLALHEQMYDTEAAADEAHEVHIFAKPDATVQFVQDTFSRLVADYRRDNRKTIVILSIGMNDTKAIETPDNFANTPEGYKASISALLDGLAAAADAVLCVGFTPVDESKTFPKRNPFTGKYSYFSNERIRLFDTVFKEAASVRNMPYVDVLAGVGDDWLAACLSADGLHPNDAGHRSIFERVMPELSRLMAL